MKKRASKGNNSRFTEGFVTASLLFCVGSMSIMGSFDAGLRSDYSTIFAKSALDGIMAVTFGATMGLGVLFSALTILVYQGALTLLAGLKACGRESAVKAAAEKYLALASEKGLGLALDPTGTVEMDKGIFSPDLPFCSISAAAFLFAASQF